MRLVDELVSLPGDKREPIAGIVSAEIAGERRGPHHLSGTLTVACSDVESCTILHHVPAHRPKRCRNRYRATFPDDTGRRLAVAVWIVLRATTRCPLCHCPTSPTVASSKARCGREVCASALVVNHAPRIYKAPSAGAATHTGMDPHSPSSSQETVDTEIDLDAPPAPHPADDPYITRIDTAGLMQCASPPSSFSSSLIQ